MYQFQHAVINFSDKTTRTFYFISTSIALIFFWIISFVLFAKNYETGVAFLIFSGFCTFFYVVSSTIIYCYYKNNDPLLPITTRRDVNDIIREINDIE